MTFKDMLGTFQGGKFSIYVTIIYPNDLSYPAALLCAQD